MGEGWGGGFVRRLCGGGLADCIRTPGNNPATHPAAFLDISLGPAPEPPHLHLLPSAHCLPAACPLPSVHCLSQVLVGLLDLPPELTHARQRAEAPAAQQQAVREFEALWDPYDWTRQIDA